MTEKKPNVLQLALVALLAIVLGACDADSPTAPTQTPNPPPPSTASTTFAITVALSPRSVEAGADTPVTVTVTARRTDNNQPVPRNSTALLSTTSGLLTNAAGAAGATVTISFDVNGVAVATLTGPAVTAIVRAQIEQSFGQATLRVTEAPEVAPLSILAVNPNFGPPSGGTQVRIEGTGFSLPTEVFIGGLPAPIQDVTGSVIRVLTPQIELASGENRTVAVTVNINVGDEDAASDTLASGFTYTRNQTALIPKIISVTPTSGPNEGGTPVTIFGEAFGSEVQVFFGDASRIEARLLEVSSTRIRVETPPATGQNAANRNAVVSVRVVDLRSGFEARLASAFQFGSPDEGMFISTVAPTEGTYFGGTLVTIFGQGFEAPIAVEFGRTPPLAQQPISVSGTEIVARSVPIEIVACARPTGPFRVVNIETNEVFTSALTYTYRPVEPEIGSVSPASTTADVDTGAIVFGSPTSTTITGAGFDRQSKPPIVTFGTERSPGVSITSLDGDPLHEGHGVGDVMDVDIPAFQGNFPEEACTTAGGLAGMRFTESRVNVTVTARDTGCSATLTNGFTYVPNDTSCRAVPVAEFSFTIAGTVVTVTDLSTGGPSSIQWDFGDGTVESGTPGESRMHDYGAGASGTTFMVKLTATNAEGSNSITKAVTFP